MNDSNRPMESGYLFRLKHIMADLIHKVNNPLMVISGRAQLSMPEDVGGEEIRKNLRIIKQQCDRISEMMQKLIVFSRAGQEIAGRVSVNKCLEDAAEHLADELSAGNISVKKELADPPPVMEAAGEQLCELFTNLLMNAREAMPEGGTLRMSTATEKGKVKVEVSDTGAGMSREVVERVFDPFFTTKRGKDGLGLSLCYGIVSSCGGDIKFRTKPGKGTTVTVLLPAGRGG